MDMSWLRRKMELQNRNVIPNNVVDLYFLKIAKESTAQNKYKIATHTTEKN